MKLQQKEDAGSESEFPKQVSLYVIQLSQMPVVFISRSRSPGICVLYLKCYGSDTNPLEMCYNGFLRRFELFVDLSLLL